MKSMNEHILLPITIEINDVILFDFQLSTL
jgi:hypothetical protein